MSSEKHDTNEKHDTSEKTSVDLKDDVEEQRQIDLSNNVQARIQNPLHGIPRAKLLAQVEQFVREKDMEDRTDLFKKAALLAQNPKEFEDIAELTEEDKVAIRRETTHRWSQPYALYMTVIVCSLAAAVQGWDQTGSNGANLSFPKVLGIDDSAGAPNAERNQWIVGLINSAPYIASCLVGCWLTDPLNHFLGRRGTLFFGTAADEITQNEYTAYNKE